MNESTSHIIIEHLTALRAEVAAIKCDTIDIKERLHSIDASVVELRRSDVHLFEDGARLQVSLDRLAERIARIEKRLELT